jgi:type IV pilus assembly protein PilB
MTQVGAIHRNETARLVQQAVHEVPRDAFLAREDRRLQIIAGRSIPSPTVIGRMVQALELTPESRVLHIGTSSGYVAAVLSRVAAEVYTIERLSALSELARQRFLTLGLANIELRVGNGFRGWPEKAPFDAILVSTTSRLEDTRELELQLALWGRLVRLEGDRRTERRLIRVVRSGLDEFNREDLGPMKVTSELWDILVEMGVATTELVARAKEAAKASGRGIEEELRALAPVEESDLYRALALQHGLKYGEVDDLMERIDRALFERVPRAFLDHNHLIPLSREGDVIRVATSDPEATAAELSQVFPDCSVDLHLVTPTNFRRIWAALDLMTVGPDETHGAASPTEEAGHHQLAAGVIGATEAHAVALFETILLDAIGERASDVHLERYGDRVRVRLRVDGELRDMSRYHLTPYELLGLVNVIKVRAKLDITEHRLPQGGRLSFRAGEAPFDLRIQTQPSLHGEHVILRLLPRQKALLSIEDLGLPKEVADQYRRLLTHPAGLVLVVGPTGSGKSTTLYGGLQVLASDSKRKVITVEDPIEYSMDGIQQTQVNPDLGFTFADAVRAFLREDPDVILLGEIRDRDTAMEAIRASQTGHLVLSTLHCNDAIDAVQRLYDLGMHPNSIAAEMLAVLAQRLAKRICETCREEVEPDASIMGELHEPPGAFRCYAGKGCARCGGRGTVGRVAVIEYLRLGAEMRRAISRQLPLDDLRHVALNSGLVTMRDTALAQVVAGQIPLVELPRILTAERLAPERAG